MKNSEKASFQVLKITLVTLVLILTCGLFMRTSCMQINSVKIIFSNNYEMNILTTKNKVSEILEENHIVLLPDENVFPDKDAEITKEAVITISKVGEEKNVFVSEADSSEVVSVEKILGNYSPITEKIIIEEEKIPYETITKDATSTSSEDRANKVLQEGKDGIKEVTYKVKYQNDIEIDRTVVKEEIKQKPVNKIVQISKVTSRDSSEDKRKTIDISSETSSLAKKVEGITPIVKTLNTSAYTASTCGKSPNSTGYGVTASGNKATAWYTVAAGKAYPMGTIIYVPALSDKPNGGWFVVQDRGGAITNNKLDIYMNTYNECTQFGRKNLECYIYVK